MGGSEWFIRIERRDSIICFLRSALGFVSIEVTLNRKMLERRTASPTFTNPKRSHKKYPLIFFEYAILASTTEQVPN